MHEALNQQCRKLGQLRHSKPNRLRRAEVLRALESKYEGVQVHAARVLGEWGGGESAASLREWLVRNLEREAGWSAVGVAVQELRRCITIEDAAWVLNLYFSTRDAAYRHTLLGLATVLPPQLVRERAAIEARSSDSQQRRAAKVLLRRLHFEEQARV